MIDVMKQAILTRQAEAEKQQVTKEDNAAPETTESNIFTPRSALRQRRESRKKNSRSKGMAAEKLIRTRSPISTDRSSTTKDSSSTAQIVKGEGADEKIEGEEAALGKVGLTLPGPQTPRVEGAASSKMSKRMKRFAKAAMLAQRLSPKSAPTSPSAMSATSAMSISSAPASPSGFSVGPSRSSNKENDSLLTKDGGIPLKSVPPSLYPRMRDLQDGIYLPITMSVVVGRKMTNTAEEAGEEDEQGGEKSLCFIYFSEEDEKFTMEKVRIVIKCF